MESDSNPNHHDDTEEVMDPPQQSQNISDATPSEEREPSSTRRILACSCSCSCSFRPWYYWNCAIQFLHPLLLLLMVLVLWPAGMWALKSLLGKTDSTFHTPIPGSPSSTAQQMLHHKFPTAPTSSTNPTLLVVLSLQPQHKKEPHSSSNDIINNHTTSLIHHAYARKSSLELESYLNTRVFGENATIFVTNDTTATNTNTLHSNHHHSRCSYIQVTSYYGYQHANLTWLSMPFLSKDEQTTFLQVELQLKGQDVASLLKRYLNAVMDAMDHYYLYDDDYAHDPDPPSHSQHHATTTLFATRPDMPPPDLYIGFTGLHYFSRDLRVSTQHDLQRMDALVLPLALILVSVTLLSQTSSRKLFGRVPAATSGAGDNGATATARIRAHVKHWGRILPLLLLLPLCGMLSTVATWSIVMNCFVVSRMQITQFTPSIMMSLTLGMGIDYTLFLVARVLEALAASSSRDHNHGPPSFSSWFQAVQVMLEQAGQVVVVSGTTLLSTFLALVALPLPMLQSVGVGAAVAIASAIVMNLMVTPSLLYSPLIQKWLLPVVSPHPQRPATNEEGNFRSSENDQDLSAPLLHGHGTHSFSNEGQPPSNEPQESTGTNSIWIRLAKQVLHPYKSIIIVVIILQFLLWPVAWNAHRLDSSDLSFESLLPEDSPSLQAYHRLVDPTENGGGNFGPGKLAPYRIVFDGTKSNTTMDTEYAFGLQQDLVQMLLSKNNSHAGDDDQVGASFVGISVANNTMIPYSVYMASKMCTTSPCSVLLRCLHVLDEHMLSSDRYATYILVELESVSPFDQDGIAWLDQTRRCLDEWMTRQHHSYPAATINVYLDGTAAIAQDAVHAVYSSFPLVIASTLAVVFVLLGVVFRSIVPPLRSIVSISFTLVVSFGMAVLVYQDGIWDDWHMRSFTAVNPELSWLVPIMSFSIIVGLALDYDVFLVTRILEFRVLEKFGHESSIAAGLDATGGIITSAGLIMALAFGSLLASQSPALDQWAFLVTTAVLLDTFVVRTVLVPAMMGWTGSKHSWYPRLLPRPQVRLDGFDVLESSDEDIQSEPRSNTSDRDQLEALLQDDDKDDRARAPLDRRETLYYETIERAEDLGSPNSA